MAQTSCFSSRGHQEGAAMVTEGPIDENQAADRVEGCPENENNQLSEEEQRSFNAWSDGLCDDPFSKDRLDASWSQKSISKSFQRAEALWKNRFNPSLRWLLGGKTEDDPWDSERQDTFVAYQNLTSRSSLRLQRLEQGMLGASQQCQVVREPYIGFPLGWVRGLGTGEAGSVLHHPPSASLSQHYGQLQNLLEQRALLLFFHEYARRARVASEYVARLGGFLEGDLGELGDEDCPFQDRPNWRGLGLASLCQELRVHVRHWEALCVRARSDPYLRPVLLQRTDLLQGMRQTLGILGLQALVLMQRCVYITLGALASSQLVRVPRDSLEDMLAATELYNQVLEEQNAHRGARAWRCQVLQECGWPGLLGPGGTPPGSRGHRPSPFPVVQLMRILAKRRGRMAAEQLHRWASQQNVLTSQILHPGTLAPTWEQLLCDFPLTSLHIHPTPEPDLERDPVEEKPQARLQHQPQPWSSDMPLGAFIRQDRRSLELLFQALVSSTELLAPHVSNRPAPDRHTPDRRLQTPDRIDRILYTPDRIDQILHRTDRHTLDRTDRPGRTQGPEGSAAPKDGHSSRPSFPVNEETTLLEQAKQEATRPRSVQWLDEGQSGACLQLFGQYRSLLWKQCRQALLMIFQHPPPGSTLGSINQWSDRMLFQLLLGFNKACKTELVPEECRGVVDDFTVQLLTSTAFQNWDHVLCTSLGSGLKDKCLPRAAGDGSVVMTSTMEHFLQLTPPLLTGLQIMSHAPNWGPRQSFPPRTELLRGNTERALASVQTSTLWVMGKAYQFLSSWSLNKFLLVTQGDLKALRALGENLLQEMETLAGDEEHPHHPLPPVLMRQQTGRLRQATSHLQVFSEVVMKIFSMDCKKMSGEIFEQTMPSAKHWRLTYRMDLPRSPSEYASSAAQSVIGQVLEGVQPLPEEARVPALTEAMTAFMEAWMEHILKQKIKFSIQGALQLKQDFDLIRDLIRSEEYSLSEELHQRLLSLRVFQQVDSAIVCLLQQPLAKTYMPSRGWEPFRRCCPNSASVVDQAAGSMNNLESMEIGVVCQQALNQGDNSLTSDLPTTSPPESYLALGHAQQEWLDLRIHSGSRWRLPGLHCLSKTEP